MTQPADDDSETDAQSPPDAIDHADRESQPVDAEAPPKLPFVVVGIGASAGGLEVVGDFIQSVPPDSGMAYVLIQHLPPTGESMLADILSRRTPMPVLQIDAGIPLEPNHVYVIRPGFTVSLDDGRFKLGERLASPMHNRPIDDFFKSLASEQRERSVAIIMSGMGSNGAAGAQAVKAVGGLCIAQDPESAQYPSMPRHLIEAGYADYVLRPKDIIPVVLAYADHPYARGERQDRANLAKRDQQHLREIFAILRTRTRHDFSGYKRPTVLRRVQRRMGLNRITNLGDYAKFVRQSPTEVAALADDLLIHVTGFFRDPEAWEALRQCVILPLIAARQSDESIRCWVTACSSGEEAYSLAMLLVEEAERVNKNLDIKIFATDMAERTLQNARTGTYPGGIESEIEPRRLDRFFYREDAVYRIRQELRERVVFAPQNVLQDPPFSRLDIISCRNLLIYLEPQMQTRLLGLLHFGLREGGALFLGNSETIGNEAFFEPIDKRARIFRRLGPTRHGSVEFPLPHTLRSHSDSPERPLELRSPSRPSISQMTTRALLDHHTAPAVTVDRDYRIVYFHGKTEAFINSPRGEPTRDLFQLARESLRGAIRTAVQRAAAENATVTVPDGWLEVEGRRVHIAVVASPLDSKNYPDYIVVSFQERGTPRDAAAAAGPEIGGTDELRRVRDELQSTIEELQTTNEELKASHEEVVSTNEELQSSNEELETSREEMQSLNEELSTVNAQLHAKVEEHHAASNDLASLLASTHLAVLFLDTHLRIRRFTPAARDLVELIGSDVGRPLSDLAQKFTDPDLADDAHAVLQKLIPQERAITASDGRGYLRRITPYRTNENRIEGIVVTFVDITARRDAEEALRRSEARYRSLFDTMDEAFVLLQPVYDDSRAVIDFTLRDANPAFDRNFALADAAGRPVRQFLSDLLRFWNDYLAAVLHTGTAVRFQDRLTALDRSVEIFASRVGDLDNPTIALLLTDITARKQAEAAQREGEERFRLLVDGARDHAMIMLDPSGRIAAWNEGAKRLLLYDEAEAIGLDGGIIFTPEDRAIGADRQELNTGAINGCASDERWHVRKGGERFWGSGVMTALRNSDNSLRGYVKIFRDETLRKQAETLLQASKETAESANRMKDEFLATLSHELRTPLSAILLWTKILERNVPAMSPVQVQEALTAIHNSADAQKELIEDLLDVSRITSGNLRLQMRDIALLPLIRDALDAIVPTTEAKGVLVKADLQEDVGFVRADPDRLRQIIWNLLTNAAKFTPSGGSIQFELRRREGQIQIRVADTGHGIDPKFLPHIFERFRQADSSHARSQGGMGLGLAIVRQLVELHGGTIAAESAGADQGSVFTVRLPLPRTTARKSEPAASLVEKPTAVLAASLSGRKLLLIDDHQETRKAVAMLLRQTGLLVIEAGSASEAIAALDEAFPDLIISDIGLPGEDGYSLIRRIRDKESRARHPHAPAIALTAFARETDRQMALHAGFQRHVGKPVDPEHLLALLLELAASP